MEKLNSEKPTARKTRSYKAISFQVRSMSYSDP